MAGPWLSLISSTGLSSGPAPPRHLVCEARVSPWTFTADLQVPRSAPEPRMLACSQPQSPRLPAPPVLVMVEKPQTNQKLGVCPADRSSETSWSRLGPAGQDPGQGDWGGPLQVGPPLGAFLQGPAGEQDRLPFVAGSVSPGGCVCRAPASALAR